MPKTSPAKIISRPRLSAALDRFLSSTTVDGDASIARYLARGGQLVDPPAFEVMRSLMPVLRNKLAAIEGETLLPATLQVLTRYFQECDAEKQPLSPALQETTFALLYFIKGFDRIPDSVPEVGLLDDALVAQTVVQRHRAALRTHWQRYGRPWPVKL